jgi:mandelate racemase
LAEPFKLDDGNLVIPDKPGAGIEWNEDAVKRYRYDA